MAILARRCNEIFCIKYIETKSFNGCYQKRCVKRPKDKCERLTNKKNTLKQFIQCSLIAKYIAPDGRFICGNHKREIEKLNKLKGKKVFCKKIKKGITKERIDYELGLKHNRINLKKLGIKTILVKE